MTTCFARSFTRVCERTRIRPTSGVPCRTSHRQQAASRGRRLKALTRDCSVLACSEVRVTISRHIRLNAFDMACVGHIQHGMWTHPRDHSSDYASLDHWVRLARMLERGLFDGLLLADVLGAYDVYGGNADASLRAGVQIPLLA